MGLFSFGTEKKIVHIFDRHLRKALDVLANSHIPLKKEEAKQKSMEITAALYVLADYSVLVSSKLSKIDRKACSDAMIRHIFRGYTQAEYEVDGAYFDKRTEFYASVIRGKPLKGITLPGVDLSSAKVHGFVGRCTAALSDCLIDSRNIEDYDNSPTMTLDSEALDSCFETLTRPIGEIMLSLFSDIIPK